MAILLDDLAQAALARRRARHRDETLVLYVATVPFPGPESDPEVLDICWASSRRARLKRDLILYLVGDHVLLIDRRIARYVADHDLTVSAWRLGPISQPTIEHDWYVLKELRAWERAFPVEERRPAA